jgi:hypothetical protein
MHPEKQIQFSFWYPYSSSNVIRVIKSRRIREVGHIAHMEKDRGAYSILVGRPEGNRPLGIPGCRQEENIKMILKEV